MEIQEIWGVECSRIAAYFAEEAGAPVSWEGYCLNRCRITLHELPPRRMGSLCLPQTAVFIQGPEEPCRQIYHRFFMRFLSAGG